MRWMAIALLLVLAGCDGGELSEGVVTNLPDGTASGAAMSGSYKLDIVTRSCSGNCPRIPVFIFTVTICEVGHVEDATATVTQNNGHVDVSSSGLLVKYNSGGINSDGSFDIGGAGSPYNGIQVTQRARGVLQPSGDFTAQAKAHGQGQAEGTSVFINCTATYDVTGRRTK